MAAEWYYAKSGQSVGPMTKEQLKEMVRSGELSPADMVWKQGMAKWMEASQVEGLFEAGPSQAVPPTPPPLPKAEWYFIKDGKQQGPVTADQLRAMAASSDLIWRAGMPQWVPGSTITGLFPGGSPRQPVPPSPPKPADSSRQSSVSAADRAVDHFNRGIDFHKQGEYARALAEFAEAYRLDPSDSDYRNNLAVSHYNRGLDHTEQGDSARALADFTEAFRLDPASDDYRNTLAIAHFNRGIDYTKQGDSARALADFTEAFRLDSTNADYRQNVAATHHILGVTYFTNKDYAKAKAEFHEAVRLDPADKVYQECLATTNHNLQALLAATAPAKPSVSVQPVQSAAARIAAATAAAAAQMDANRAEAKSKMDALRAKYASESEVEFAEQQESSSSADASPSPPVKKTEPGKRTRGSSPTPTTVPTSQGVPRPGESPAYADCPVCGFAANLTGISDDQIICCKGCKRESSANAWLNRRSTPQRVEERGWLGRIFAGSTIEKSYRERRDEAIESLKHDIGRENVMRMSAVYSGDHLKAQYHLQEIERYQRELELDRLQQEADDEFDEFEPDEDPVSD